MGMKEVSVTLNAYELKICKFLADERQNTNDANGVKDRRIDPNRNSFEVHFQGTKGEFAVAKYLNIYPDFNVYSRKGGHDLVYCEKKLDVKNAHPHVNLMTPATKQLGEADIYVCVTGDNPIILLGWCYERALINPNRLVDWTPVRAYFMERRMLNDIYSLEALAREYIWE